MWRLYTPDGFDEVARFTTGSSMHRWLSFHPGHYVVDQGDGRMVAVGQAESRSQKQSSYESLFATASDTRGGGWKPGQFEASQHAARALTRRARTTELVGPRRADGSYYADKPAGRWPASGSRNGTGHTHPPGRTRCPKCGV